MKRTQYGITLVALVITIIILLILAGITISALKGSELFAKAQQAKQKTNEAAAIEEMSIIVSQVQVDKLGDATLSDVVEVLESDTENTYIVRTTKTVATLDSSGITDITQITSETPAIYVTNTKYNVEVEINSSLKIASNGTEGSSNSGTNTGAGNGSGSNEETEVDSNTIKTKLSCTAESSTQDGEYAIKITVTDTNNYNKIEYYIDGNLIYTSEDGSEKTYYAKGFSADGSNKTIRVYGYTTVVDSGTDIQIACYPSLYSQVSVGDWVNYDAGDWSDKASSILTSGLPASQGEFSILTSTSKNETITPYGTNENIYSGGWRVLSKNTSKQTVTLVHAGTPASYYHKSGYSSSSVTNLNDFCSAYYGAHESRPMVNSARSVVRTDYDSGNLTNFTGLLRTGSWYWFASSEDVGLKLVTNDGSTNRYGKDTNRGVRPVVSLKSGVQTTGKTTNAYNTSVQGWDLTYSE